MADELDLDLSVSAFTEYNEDGFLGIGVGPLGGKEGSAVPFEAISPYGFLSRHHDPDADADGVPTLGGTVLEAREGSRNAYAMALGDPRVTPKVPQVDKGGSMQYGAPKAGGPASFSVIKTEGEDPGSWVVYCATQDLTQGSYIKLSPKNGLEISLPWGRLTFGPLGFHVLHSSSARIDLGSRGGLPAPLSSFTSYASMSANGTVSLKGAVTKIGQDGGLNNGLAVEALKAFTAAVNTFAVAANAAVATATPTSGITAANITAMTTATTALTASLTALQALINGLGRAV